MALTVAVLGAGCSDSGGADTTATTTTEAPSTTSTTEASSEAEVVIAAFEEAALAAIRAGMIPDPDYPDLERTHTGPMLDQAREALRGYQLRKIAFRYPEPLESGFRVTVDPATVELTDDTAVFDACTVDEGTRINTETGDPVSDGEGETTVLMRVGMRRVDGTWKLAERRNLRSFGDSEECSA